MTDVAPRRPAVTHYRYSDGRIVPMAGRSGAWRWLGMLLVLVSAAGVSAVAAVAVFLWAADRTPREWAPYLQRRALRHNPVIVGAAEIAASWLASADRLAAASPPNLPPQLGASADRSGPLPADAVTEVASMDDLAHAAAAAKPGDTIVLRPGRYRFSGYYAIKFDQPGTARAPITVRAAKLGDAVIESDAVVAFQVSAPYWHFENLVITGVCGDHTNCEHAFHVVSGGAGTIIRNNRLTDFNAHIKINGEDGRFPDGGVIQGNTITDTAPRATSNPVTPIDLVAASDWDISDNIIADFVRAVPGNATYGAYVKGAGEGNRLERNLVVCEWKLRGVPGQHVGLSLGGGGTAPDFSRDLGRTGFEQVGGAIRDNVITGCSDAGIYLNRAARSVLDHNTLLDTAGIDARFVETSVTVTANIVDGAVRSRDGASLKGWGNDTAWLLGLFAGIHPQRGFFRDPGRLDLNWRSRPDGVSDPDPRPDICGAQRKDPSAPGAFDDFGPCLSAQ
jgi:parallel beta-helix repeat protein